MYYILRFLQHACSVIKFVILTIVCRSKSASELMLHCYVYSTLNKSSMSMSLSMSMSILAMCGVCLCATAKNRFCMYRKNWSVKISRFKTSVAGLKCEGCQLGLEGNKTFRPQDLSPLVVSPLVVSPLFSHLVVSPHIP